MKNKNTHSGWMVKLDGWLMDYFKNDILINSFGVDACATDDDYVILIFSTSRILQLVIEIIDNEIIKNTNNKSLLIMKP